MNSQTDKKSKTIAKKPLLFYLLYGSFSLSFAAYSFFVIKHKNHGVFPLKELHNLIFHKGKKQAVLPQDINKEIDEIVYVEVYKVAKEDTEVTFDTYGTIIGQQEQSISFDTGGKIVFISDVRKVKKGDVYLSLDTSQLQWKKDGYMAQLIAKKNYLKRLKELHKSDLASITQLEEVKKDVATIESTLGEIEVQMSNMILTAPCDGYFFVKNIASNVGAVVQPRQELGYFFSAKKQIKFYIPHSYLMDLKPEEEIRVIFFPDFDGNQQPVEGILTYNLKYIRPISANESEHNPQMCEAVADILKEESISPMFYNQNGKIRLMFNKINNYCLIPEIAVITRGAKSFVYVVQDNRAVLLEIQPLGTNKQGYVRVQQPDISEDTVIVLRGLNKVSHMSKVKITDSLTKTVVVDDKKDTK